MTTREEIYRRALFYIGNADSGLWGIKAREALDEARRLVDEPSPAPCDRLAPEGSES